MIPLTASLCAAFTDATSKVSGSSAAVWDWARMQQVKMPKEAIAETALPAATAICTDGIWIDTRRALLCISVYRNRKLQEEPNGCRKSVIPWRSGEIS